MGLFSFLFGSCSKPKEAATPPAEYSANFDTDTLDTLMQRVSARWPDIVTSQRLRDFMAFVRSLQHDDEKPFSFTVQHNGTPATITFKVFMDDIDAPDVAFFGFPEFIQSIESEHAKLCKELGI